MNNRNISYKQASRIHSSIGPSGLLQALPKTSPMFPNLFDLEFYVDCTADVNSSAAPASAVAGELGRSLGGDIFLKAVDKIVMQLFEHEEVFTPVQLFSSSDRKPISLASSEFSVETLDPDTNWVWIDTFFFLEKNAIPEKLIEAKKRVGQISAAEESQWKKPRYIRLMVFIGRALYFQSPRYFFGKEHPGLGANVSFFASEEIDELRPKHEKRATVITRQPRSISPNQLIMDFSAAYFLIFFLTSSNN